jgi:hypothetical protein
MERRMTALFKTGVMIRIATMMTTTMGKAINSRITRR